MGSGVEPLSRETTHRKIEKKTVVSQAEMKKEGTKEASPQCNFIKGVRGRWGKDEGGQLSTFRFLSSEEEGGKFW